jgi:hypothetical protein
MTGETAVGKLHLQWGPRGPAPLLFVRNLPLNFSKTQYFIPKLSDFFSISGGAPPFWSAPPPFRNFWIRHWLVNVNLHVLEGVHVWTICKLLIPNRCIKICTVWVLYVHLHFLKYFWHLIEYMYFTGQNAFGVFWLQDHETSQA